MAMQTGVASSKILILVGAGLTGSIILKNGRLSDVLAELQELMKGVNQVEISSNHYDTSILAAQIRHLAQEVRELTLSRPVAIFNGESTSSGNLASYIMPAAAIGAMGYCYMWWKGWSFSDVMFVTKRNMAAAVANVSKQLEQVSTTLSVTKRHLSQRLENLDGKLDEQKETSKLIMNEVHDVRTDLSQIGFDIESIQKMVSGLEGKIGLLESKQDMTNTGIYYLCQIAGGIKDGFNTKFFQYWLCERAPIFEQRSGLEEKTPRAVRWDLQNISRSLLEVDLKKIDSNTEASSKLQFNRSSPALPEVEPLQGLQFLADALKPGEQEELKTDDISRKDLSGKPVKNTFTKTTAIHRSYPSGISLRREGLLL